MSVGGGEGAEIPDMGVAAHLHDQPGGGPFRQILRHEARGPAQKSERRGRHAAHLDGHQLAQPLFVDPFEQEQRIGTIVGRPPFALIDPPDNRPQAATAFAAFGRGRNRERSTVFITAIHPRWQLFSARRCCLGRA